MKTRCFLISVFLFSCWPIHAVYADVTAISCAGIFQDAVTAIAPLQDCPPQNQAGPNGNGTATASLSMGILRARATTTGFLDPDFHVLVGNLGFASATASDTVVIHGVGEGLVPIRVALHVTGSVSGVSSASSIALLEFTAVDNGAVDIHYDGTTVTIDDVSAGPTDLTLLSAAPENIELVLAQTVMVSATNNSFWVRMAIHLNPSAATVGSVTSAFDNTVRLSIDLPPGLSYTSESGALLSIDDSDGDGFFDTEDNCTLAQNGDQRDTDGDGFGNRCDPDLNNDCAINFFDLGLLKSVFFTSSSNADFNGDGQVNFVDLGAMKAFFFGAPGPSGIPNICSE